jgi:hypothetical protein
MIVQNKDSEQYLVEYVRLLVKLHRLIEAGHGDDDEADEIRHQMDGPWRQLSVKEVAFVNRLSAALGTEYANTSK